VALHSAQLQINGQISAFIGRGANIVQVAMSTSGVGIQYAQAAGIFVNPTNIEVNGPRTFDNITTF